MMNKKLKGFSLAELLISLLIISIVLSAAIPTITKKSGANREYIWKWSNENNNTYFGNGDNQSAIIGYDRNPLQSITAYAVQQGATGQDGTIGSSIENVLEDASSNDAGIGHINLSDMFFSKDGDRLILLKKPELLEDTNLYNFTNSHISFYTTTKRKAEATDTANSYIKYAGKITLDPENIAIGKGALQRQRMTDAGENTAIGHFALLRNTAGSRNTAIGKKTLSNNEGGGLNTAIGFGSLFELGSKSLPSEINNSYRGSGTGNENTAVGAMSQEYNSIGQQNTSIGSQSLRNLQLVDGATIAGDANTALGFSAMSSLMTGDDNTGVGSSACIAVKQGSHNICLGGNSGYTELRGGIKTPLIKDNYGVYIGSSPLQENATDENYDIYKDGSAPLISGHSRKAKATFSNNEEKEFEQELNINARNVAFRPFNAAFDAFKFESLMGATDSTGRSGGYVSGGNRWSRAFFNLRDNWSGAEITSSTDKTSVQLKFYAVGGDGDKTGVNSKTAIIDSFDPAGAFLGDLNSLADINFNQMLNFSFPIKDKGTSVPKVYISGKNVPALSSFTNPYRSYPIVLNGVLEFAADIKTKDVKSYPMPVLTLKVDEAAGVVNSKKSISTYQYDKLKAEIKVEKDENSEVSLAQSAKTNKIAIAQAGDNNDISINQAASDAKLFITQKADGDFGVFHGAINNSSPRLQLQKDKFYALSLAEASIQAGKVDIKGTSDGDVCIGTVCLLKNDQRIRTLELANATPSDARLKNISGDSTAGLKEINALEVKNFTYKNDKEKTPHVGVIAQQLQKIFPDAVTKDDEGYLRIRTEDIFYAMVNSIKDLFKQVQDLTAKITGLDKRLTELEAQNKLLQEQNKLLQKQNKAIERRLAKLERKAAK